MKKYHNTLLATAAAAALVVSAGLASGQEPSKSQTPGAAPHPAQSNPMAQRPSGAPPSSAAQERPSGEHPATAQEQQRPGGTGTEQKPSNTAAQEQQRRGGTGAQQPSNNRESAQEQQRRNGMSGQQKPSNTRSTAQQPEHGNSSTAQRQGTRNEPHGLQGNASGTNVKLSDQQRTDLKRTVINGSGAPKVGHVDFDVTVGTVVPRDRIHIVPVPETLVQIEPSWRGFLYFVYEDDIVVVDPHNMQIVAVLLV